MRKFTEPKNTCFAHPWSWSAPSSNRGGAILTFLDDVSMPEAWMCTHRKLECVYPLPIGFHWAPLRGSWYTSQFKQGK